jgi:hypothetical protein
LTIAGCFLTYSDAEFAQNRPIRMRARTLYEVAVDLLDLPEVKQETGRTIPLPANPEADEPITARAVDLRPKGT